MSGPQVFGGTCRCGQLGGHNGPCGPVPELGTFTVHDTTPAPPLQPVPTVGRIVHYQAGSGLSGVELPLQAWAAIVLGTHDDLTVDLFVMSVEFQAVASGVRFSPEPALGCWNWPPRV